MRTIESRLHSSIRMMFSGFIVVLILFSSTAGLMPIFTGAEPIENNNEFIYNTEKLSLKVTEQNTDHGYQIIQFAGPIRESWKEQVTALGVELFGYLPDFAFLADIHIVQKSTIVNLPFINSIQPYLPEHKYSPYYFDQYSNSAPIEIIIDLFHGLEPEHELEAGIVEVTNKITQLGGEITDASQNKFFVIIEPDQIPKLAELNEVLWIEPVLVFEYLNDVATGIMDVQPVWENLTLNGTGQVVTVCDSGLDNGSYTNLHEDFRGRLIHAYAIGRSGIWNDANIHDFTGKGVGGHGTHVAGSVLGAGNHSAGQYSGIAYNASLVLQATMTTSGALAIPNDMYNNLFFPPYNSYGSRIHTNSWGTAQNPGEYSANSRSVDDFVWDYPDQVILFAAGNSQTQSNVFSPSTAKNCITVGASESFRPTLTTYGSECNNINQRAYFSCYGTTDNRLKPDILAPGTGILSTRSSMVDDVTNHYWVAYDAYYAYAGGTSMATPITAGVVTLIRQYYTDLEGITPSAALVKATLMNGAVDMEGTGITPPPIPNYQEGWGRINLENSIFPELPSNLMYIDNVTGLTTDKNFTYTVEVLNDSIPLNITLVWSDFPATASASVVLVNDLHLNVTHLSSGAGFKGNVFNNGWSSSDDADANPDWDQSVPADGYDNRNNVEGVRIANPEKGRYKITVVGNNVPSGPQPFALALTGGLNPKTLLPPSNIQVDPVPEGNALNITWEPVFGPTIKGYEIFRSTSPISGFGEIFSTNSSNKMKYLNTNLIDGTTYYYKLRTKNIFSNVSDFSLPVSGIPQDSMPPWVQVHYPIMGELLNKNVTIEYTNDTDCANILFKYYNDTNLNGIQDDGSDWVIIGMDSELTGTFVWNTTAGASGPGNQQAIIFGAEAWDEVPNIGEILVLNLEVDNQPPDAPEINTFSPNPVNLTNITLTGLTEAKGNVFLYSNGNQVGSNSTNYTGQFKVEVALFEGLNAVTARANDYLGNGPGPPSALQNIVVDTVPPVANAGGNFIIIEDTWMRFNGSSSFDTNPVPGYDQIASYTWSFKFQNGSHILLEGPEPSYYFDTMGNYTITLSVRDSAQNLDSQKFWIRVQDNTTPLAVAGMNFTDDEDIEFFLDAGASTDNDPKFNITGNFTWTFNNYDEARIEEGRIVEVVLVGSNVTYNFSTPGTYNITLTVTDAAGNFDTDNITVTIRDTEPPVAVATSDKIVVTLGRTVAFSGHKSTDNDPTFPGTGNFTWEFKYIDEEIIFYGLEVDFRFLKINAFTIKLTVTDNGNNSASHSINIIVSADLHLPTVEWTVPGDSGINVRVTTVIKIKLSERLDIEHTPLNLTTFQLLDSSYQPLDGELFYDPEDSLIRFIPASVLNFGESYTVQLLGSLVDMARNHLDGNGNGLLDSINEDLFKIVFTTSNITTSPYNYQMDTPIDTTITATFSGNVSNWTLLNTVLTMTDVKNGELVLGTLEFDLVNYSIMFKPLTKLQENRYYRVSLIIKFYLSSASNITPVAINRESLSVPVNITDVQDGNVSYFLYSWTFNTEAKADGDDSILGGLGEYLLLIILIIIIIIVIILISVPLLFYRMRRAKKIAGDGRVSKDFDEDYAEEYREVYGEYPTETETQRPRGSRASRGRHKPRERSDRYDRGKRRGAKAVPKRTERLRAAEPISPRGSGKRRREKEPEPEEEELEWDRDDEFEDDEGFDFEEEYITEFTDDEELEDFEPEDEIEGDFEFEFDEEEGEPEFEADEELEELEELEEAEELPEEVEELEEMEELEEVEEFDELEE